MDDKRSNQPEPTDEAEVEGHRRRFHATEEPQPGDEADVEGHASKFTRLGATADEPEEGRNIR